MKLLLKPAIATAALALSAAPALASSRPPSGVPPVNHGASHNHGNNHGNGNGHGHGDGNGNGPGAFYTQHPPGPGPGASLPAKAKAYGKLCKGQSKKHVPGQKGTPFSQCVTAMAKAAHNRKLSPRQACKGMSKKHVPGQKGTPFSQCVSAAARLRGQ